MKILSTPDYTAWKYEFNCSTCDSKLCAEHTDIKYRIEKIWVSDSYGDGGDYQKCDYYYAVCPVCSAEKELIPTTNFANIPYLLLKKVKKNK